MGRDLMIGQYLQELFSPGIPHRIGRIKFFVGLLLFLSSFILAKVALAVLSMDLHLSLSMYAISWAIFFGGIALCGKDGLHEAKSLAVHFGKKITNCLSRKDSG